MTYLSALASELRHAGVPSRRRRRILTEFADHLHENPHAALGDPGELARQFADELGTRLARRAAIVAFIGLAITGLAIGAVFLVGTRIVRLAPNVHQVISQSPSAVVPLLAAQVALASGLLALLRAWRLRRVPVITGADARILYRRAGIGLVAGVVTLTLPLGGSASPGKVYVRPQNVSGILLLMLLVLLLYTLKAGWLRPSRTGPAGDLTFDLGTRDPRVTPLRLALALSATIGVLLAAAGVLADDPYDGIARGLLDGSACMAGFIVLGRYLGLRISG